MEGADAPVAAEETAEEVLAAAAAAGHDLSRDQLIRLHQHGLIPRPRQAHERPDGRRGTATLYPAGAAALVVSICELRQNEHRLDELGWLCWWHGLPVPDGLGRDYLTAQMAAFIATKDEYVTAEGELTDKAEEALDVAHEAQIDQMSVRWARRRVGTQDFGLFLSLLLSVAGGRAGDLTSEHIEMLDHGLGRDRARTDTLATTGGPWLDSDPREDFEAVGQRISTESLGKALAEASDDQLREARDKAKALAGVVSNLGRVLRETGDRWSHGYAAYGAILDDLITVPATQAMFILFLLSCVAADGSDGLDQIVAQSAEAARTAKMVDALKALREEVPEVGEAITMRMFGRAIRDASYQETITAKFAELRAEKTCADKIDAFFDTHPEHRLTDDA